MTHAEVKKLGDILGSGAHGMLSYLTQDGLFIDSRSGRFDKLLLDDANEPFGLNDDVRELANQLGTGVYGYQYELVWWADDADTKRPLLLSHREPTALGRLAADGTFEHVVTVLNQTHPARWGNDTEGTQND